MLSAYSCAMKRLFFFSMINQNSILKINMKNLHFQYVTYFISSRPKTVFIFSTTEFKMFLMLCVDEI